MHKLAIIVPTEFPPILKFTLPQCSFYIFMYHFRFLSNNIAYSSWQLFSFYSIVLCILHFIPYYEHFLKTNITTCGHWTYMDIEAVRIKHSNTFQWSSNDIWQYTLSYKPTFPCQTKCTPYGAFHWAACDNLQCSRYPGKSRGWPPLIIPW